MTDIVLNTLSNLIFAVTVCIVMRSLQQVHSQWEKKNGILFLILGLWSFVTAVVTLPFYVSFGLAVILGILLTKGRLPDRLINLSIVFLALTLVQLLGVLACSLCYNVDWKNSLFELILNVGVFGLVLFISRCEFYKCAASSLAGFSRKKRAFLLVLIMISSALAGVGAAMEVTWKRSQTAVFFGVTVLSGLLCVLACVFWLVRETYRAKCIQDRMEMQERVIEAQKQYFEMLQEKEKELRIFRHDIGSQLGVLWHLFEKQDMEELGKQMARIMDGYKQTANHSIHVGDETVDAILNAEFAKATKHGIDIKVEGKMMNAGQYGIYDLCSVISNSVRNALEACERLTGERSIFIEFLEHNGTLRYMIKNPATETDFEHLIGGATAKSDKTLHGYGVKSIREAVQRLKGSMEYQYENGCVILEVII